MRMSYIVFGVIICSTIIVLLSGIINNLGVTYPNLINDGTDLATFAQFNQTQQFSNAIRASFTPSQSTTVIDVISNYVSFATNSVRLIFGSIPIVSTFAYESAQLLNIDVIIIDAIIGIFIIALGFGVWNMITRWFN